MSDSFIGKIGNLLLSTIIGSMIVSTGFGVAMLFLTAFCQAPTGEYYIAAEPTGYISIVKEDVRFGIDRVIYTGPHGEAWRVYSFMEYGPPSVKPDPNRTALQLL